MVRIGENQAMLFGGEVGANFNLISAEIKEIGVCSYSNSCFVWEVCSIKERIGPI